MAAARTCDGGRRRLDAEYRIQTGIRTAPDSTVVDPNRPPTTTAGCPEVVSSFSPSPRHRKTQDLGMQVPPCLARQLHPHQRKSSRISRPAQFFPAALPQQPADAGGQRGVIPAPANFQPLKTCHSRSIRRLPCVPSGPGAGRLRISAVTLISYSGSSWWIISTVSVSCGHMEASAKIRSHTTAPAAR